MEPPPLGLMQLPLQGPEPPHYWQPSEVALAWPIEQRPCHDWKCLMVRALTLADPFRDSMLMMWKPAATHLHAQMLGLRSCSRWKPKFEATSCSQTNLLSEPPWMQQHYAHQELQQTPSPQEAPLRDVPFFLLLKLWVLRG